MRVFRNRIPVVHPTLILAGLSLVAVVLLAGCLSERATPTPADEPPVSDNPAAWHFESADTGSRLRELDACARNLAATGWQHVPYTPGGNYYEARWCTGAVGGADCIPAGNDTRNQQTIQLYTFFTPNAPQTFFGLGLVARWAPPVQGWSAQVSFSEGGRGIEAPGFSLLFASYDGTSSRPALTLDLGSEYQYRVQETTVILTSGLALRDDLARYLVSAEAMRDLGIQNLTALQQRVTTTLAAHQAEACDYGTPPANGGAPPCRRRPLTAAEEQTALNAAQSWFAAQTAALHDHYQEMWDALLRAFPLDRCRP